MPRLADRGLTPVALAARIRAERERLGLTRTEAAARLLVHRRTYDQLERAANPTVATLAKLVALGMNARALLPELLDR